MIDFNTDICELQGVGKKRTELLNKLSIYKVKDLLEYFPIAYNQINPPKNILNAVIDTKEYIRIRIIGFSQSFKLTIAKSTDGYTPINLKWFNSPYIMSKVRIGKEYVAYGYVKKNKSSYELIQPILYSVEEYNDMIGKILPIYSLTKGLSNNILSKLILDTLNKINFTDDIFSKELRNEFCLPHYDFTIRTLHNPCKLEDIDIAKYRLIFQELYKFMSKMKKLKLSKNDIKNNFNINEHISINEFEEVIGFSLTNAQKNSIRDIMSNLKSESSMSRLLQGDVGSGKTIVAFITMINVALSGYQAAIMAPTEILAQQHYNNFIKLIKQLGIELSVEFLSSSTKIAQKRIAYENISTGNTKIIIGTHSIIWKDLEYKNLAYVVTDEQHRFGVNQRQELANKGYKPHILVMSATPIPRTLAIMLYGDMDISIIDELPVNRIPIKNKVVDSNYEKAAYNLIEREVNAGRQAYVVCPLVEESENYDCVDVLSEYEKINKFYAGKINVGLLHGQMKSSEKEKIMQEFKDRKIDVLVSTVVIEVGVDVPNATVMVIVDPQRFGLAQLHQLRGRVGRGKHQSYCVFLILSAGSTSSKRLEILEKTNDGFKIANEDLKLRGAGDFFGFRQSGDFNFKFADIYENTDMIRKVNVAIDKYGYIDDEDITNISSTI